MVSPCINYDSTHPQNSKLIPFLKQSDQGYCFGIKSEMDRYCFDPQADGTLKVYFQIYTGMRVGSIQLAIGKGYLHKTEGNNQKS